jgi:hypothetical protein
MRLLMLFWGLVPASLCAQSLVIDLTNNTTVEHPITAVRSTVAGSSDFRVNLWSGAVEVYELSSIARMEFAGLPTSLGQRSQGAEDWTLFPNPSSGSVRITCPVTHEGPVQLDILDAVGRPVRALYRGAAVSPALVLDWDGTNDDGGLVAEGAYLCRMQQGTAALTRSIIIHR